MSKSSQNVIEMPVSILVTAPGRRQRLISIAGKEGESRMDAFEQIAGLSYAESKSRTENVRALNVALGKDPTGTQLTVARTQQMAGRMAHRLPASAFPRQGMTIAQQIAYAVDLITNYAACPKDGVGDVSKLRANQKGYRTAEQEKVFRAAESQWSLIKAELGFSLAKTQKQKAIDAKKALADKAVADAKVAADTAAAIAEVDAAVKAPDTRAPQMAGTAAGAVIALTGEPDVIDAKRAVGHIVLQLSLLQQYANKHAAVLPTAYGTIVRRAYASALQIEKDVELAKLETAKAAPTPPVTAPKARRGKAAKA